MGEKNKMRTSTQTNDNSQKKPTNKSKNKTKKLAGKQQKAKNEKEQNFIWQNTQTHTQSSKD